MNDQISHLRNMHLGELRDVITERCNDQHFKGCLCDPICLAIKLSRYTQIRDFYINLAEAADDPDPETAEVRKSFPQQIFAILAWEVIRIGDLTYVDEFSV